MQIELVNPMALVLEEYERAKLEKARADREKRLAAIRQTIGHTYNGKVETLWLKGRHGPG